MAETPVPISQIDVGISKAELSNPKAAEALMDKAVENIMAEKMDFQLHFAHILNLDEAGYFEKNPDVKEQLVQGARDPEYLEEVFILADDARQVLDDSDNFTTEDQEAARQQLKDLKRVSEICHIDRMPQFSPDELNPEEAGIIQETWSEIWPVIEGYFSNYLEPRESADSVLALFEELIQIEGISNTKEAVDKLITVLGPHAVELTTDQLIQLPPYVLLRLMTEGDLSSARMLGLPDNSQNLANLDLVQKGIEAYRFGYSEMHKVLSRYSNLALPATTTDELEKLAQKYMEEIKENTASDLNFQKGMHGILALTEQKLRGGEIERRKSEAYDSFYSAFSELFYAKYALSKYEESLNPPPESDDEPLAATAAPTAPEPPAPPEPTPLSEAPTLFAPESPFVNYAEEEALQAWETWGREDYTKFNMGDWEKFLTDFTARERERRSGITGFVEIVEYQPKGYLPKGLGKWVSQRSDLSQEAPPINARWVREPEPGSMVAIKVARPDPQAYGQLSSERWALSQFNDIFKDDQPSRPPRLLGYGVNENGDPYLVMEYIGGDFRPLADFGGERGQTMPEQEAVEIALKIATILDIAHQSNIGYGDFAQIDNIFWDREGKRLRLIDWGNGHKVIDPINNRNFYYDRSDLGKLLFRLVTSYNTSYPNLLADPNYQKLSDQLSQPVREIIEWSHQSYSPDSRYQPDNPEDTAKMTQDLEQALRELQEIQRVNGAK